MTFHEAIELFNSSKPRAGIVQPKESTQEWKKVDPEEEEVLELSSSSTLPPNAGMSNHLILDYSS